MDGLGGCVAADLQAEFPGVGGFSASNLWRMRSGI